MHNNEKQTFTMTMLRRHNTAFSRQVEEAVVIANGKRDNILNSKKEFMGESIPRLQVEVKNRVKQIDYNGKQLELGKPQQKKTGQQRKEHKLEMVKNQKLKGLDRKHQSQKMHL